MTKYGYVFAYEWLYDSAQSLTNASSVTTLQLYCTGNADTASHGTHLDKVCGKMTLFSRRRNFSSDVWQTMSRRVQMAISPLRPLLASPGGQMRIKRTRSHLAGRCVWRRCSRRAAIAHLRMPTLKFLCHLTKALPVTGTITSMTVGTALDGCFHYSNHTFERVHTAFSSLQWASNVRWLFGNCTGEILPRNLRLSTGSIPTGNNLQRQQHNKRARYVCLFYSVLMLLFFRLTASTQCGRSYDANGEEMLVVYKRQDAPIGFMADQTTFVFGRERKSSQFCCAKNGSTTALQPTPGWWLYLYVECYRFGHNTRCRFLHLLY